MEALKKYKESGKFIFRPEENLTSVCNAPTNKAGIYLIYAIKKGEPKLVYIGQSGRVKKDGELFIRQDGIKGRIVRGKRNGRPRKEFWLEEIYNQDLEALEFNWFVTHNEVYVDCPFELEKKLIKIHRPIWNRK